MFKMLLLPIEAHNNIEYISKLNIQYLTKVSIPLTFRQSI